MSTRPLKRNFIVNLLYPTVRIAVAFVTIPIYLRHVGEARYGDHIDRMGPPRIIRLS